MFYGLNNFIKKILPKRLFYRSLIIVATPIILLQVIITIVFFDSLWIKANKGMTRSLVGEVQTMFDIYKQGDENSQQMIINLYNKNFDFVITLKENEVFPDETPERWYSPMDRSLRRELKSAFQNSYWFDTTSYKVLTSPTKDLVIPLFVFIQRLSKKTMEIVICKIIIGAATINNAL